MYPGFEGLEEPANYDELEERLQGSVSEDPDPESLGDYFESTVHEGGYSFEEALYAVADSGIFEYDPEQHAMQVREQQEYPGIDNFSEEDWSNLAGRLPEHLVLEQTEMGLGPVSVVNAVEMPEEQKEMRRTVSEGMYEMVKSVSESYSPMLDETTHIEGSEEFAQAAWEEYQERNPEADVSLLEMAIDDWTDGVETELLKMQLEDPESELNTYREFSRDVLRDTFGQDFQMPVMRGQGMLYFAQHDPRIEQQEDDDFPEYRVREEEIIDREGVEVERTGLDAWKPREVTYYAASPDRQYEKGVILRHMADPESMILVSHTAPRMETSEIMLNDDRSSFTGEDFRKMNEQERKTFESDMIWMYDRLMEQLE